MYSSILELLTIKQNKKTVKTSPHIAYFSVLYRHFIHYRLDNNNDDNNEMKQLSPIDTYTEYFMMSLTFSHQMTCFH